jgi:glycosyl transferase family 25
MKIFVISLLESKARRAAICQQMSEKNLSFEFVDGVRVDTSTLADSGYDCKRRKLYFGYDLSPGEVGCFLAHRKVWQMVQAENENCLILEDDVLIDGLNLELVSQLSRLALTKPAPTKLPSAFILRLAGVFEKPHKFILGTQIARYWGDPSGAAAYVLGANEATRLVTKSIGFYMPVDDFLEATHLHGLNSYAWLPYPIRQANLDSCIGLRSRPPLSRWVRLRRLLLRIPVDINKQIRRIFYYSF